MVSFNGIPSMVGRAILLIKALDIKKAHKLCQSVMYLWREFYIKINITPKIEKFKVSFYYKDKQLMSTNIDNLNDITNIIEKLKESRKDG